MSSKVEYKPQYRNDNPYVSKVWCDAGYPLAEADAKRLVQLNPTKYVGEKATHRMLKVTSEVVTIETQITFKETV